MNQNRPAMSSVVATDAIKSIFTILRRGCILPHYLLLFITSFDRTTMANNTTL